MADDIQQQPKRTIPVLLVVLLLVATVAWLSTEVFFLGKTCIGATAEVTEVSSGITFDARVDTGAGVSAVHCLEMTILEGSDDPHKNVGKTVRFLLENERGDEQRIETKIVDYGRIKSIDAANYRYYVRLVLECAGIEKSTLVPLADRHHMDHRMLLGRDFLGSDFVVDVTKGSGIFR